jgi:hypothetical protein
VLFTIVGAIALSLVSFPGLTGTAGFFFDSFTLTGFARASFYLGLTNASLLYALATARARARSRVAACAFACLVATVAIAIALATGRGRVCDRPPRDRLRRAHVQRAAGRLARPLRPRPATYLVLPASDYFVGTGSESWNRDVRHVAVLQTQPPDPFPSTVARIARDGSLELGRRRGSLVANVAGSAIGLDGTVRRPPAPGARRVSAIPAHPHVRWLADGLAPDRWTGPKLRYQAWPVRSGRYEMTLGCPARRAARRALDRHAGPPSSARRATCQRPDGRQPARRCRSRCRALARRSGARRAGARAALSFPARPAASRRASALSVRSQVKSRSSRPKWPYAAVLRVDRPLQVEVAQDRRRAQVEVLAHELGDPVGGICSVLNVCTAIETDARRRSRTRR